MCRVWTTAFSWFGNFQNGKALAVPSSSVRPAPATAQTAVRRREGRRGLVSAGIVD